MSQIVIPDPDGDVSRPVFVLAAPRSFTSLVTAMIGQHPELYGVPELNLFQCETIAEFNSGKSADGQGKSPYWSAMRHGLLRAVAEIYSGEQTPQSVAMAERWLKRREDQSSVEIFRELAAKVAPLNIVEKSPAVLRKQEYMQRILETCPKARFIHLVRNPVSQCKSVLNAKGGVGVLLAMNSVDHLGEKAALEPQIMWHDTQIQILRFLDTVPEDQFITIRGEQFLSNLDESLPALCRWLNISESPEAIAAMRRPEDSAYSNIGPSNAPLGNDVNFLNAPALREGNVKSPPLDSELSWREDRAPLHPGVVALAEALGY
ncbi:MAG: sulfotransferase [Rhodobacteraceae bacterium]|nr:sulfotransferase [Paracoccaceae bacterium]